MIFSLSIGPIPKRNLVPPAVAMLAGIFSTISPLSSSTTFIQRSTLRRLNEHILTSGILLSGLSSSSHRCCCLNLKRPGFLGYLRKCLIWPPDVPELCAMKAGRPGESRLLTSDNLSISDLLLLSKKRATNGW